MRGPSTDQISPADYPLHLRVALALGWTDPRATYPQNIGHPSEGGALPAPGRIVPVWMAIPPWRQAEDPAHPDHRATKCVYRWEGERCECDPDRRRLRERVLLYDQDPQAFFSLVMHYRFQVGPSYEGISPPFPWCATFGCEREREGEEWIWAPSPGEAVCRLFLLLKEKGRIA